MKAVVAAFNQDKALVGAFSVITNLRMELFQALVVTQGLGSDPALRTWLVRLRGGVRAGRGGRLGLGQGRALHQPLAVEDAQLRLEPRPRHLAALGQLACNRRASQLPTTRH